MFPIVMLVFQDRRLKLKSERRQKRQQENAADEVRVEYWMSIQKLFADTRSRLN